MDGCLQDAMRAMPKDVLPLRDPGEMDERVVVEPTEQRYKLLHEKHEDIQQDLQLKFEQLGGKPQSKPMPASETEHSKPTAILQVVTSSPTLLDCCFDVPGSSGQRCPRRPLGLQRQRVSKGHRKSPLADTRGPRSFDVFCSALHSLDFFES